MKKIINKVVAVLVICLVFSSGFLCSGQAEEVQAKSSVKIYQAFGSDISNFSKKNGKLTIKTIEPINEIKAEPGTVNIRTIIETKKKKIVYPLAKNCKWTMYSAGLNTQYASNSYKDLKERIKLEYESETELWLETELWILVKNKKIIEVRDVVR